LDGERPPLDRIEDMADLYISALPDGPVHLGGWSFGGLVAYEMACRLGDRAGLVAILDVPAREEEPPDEAEVLIRGLDEHLREELQLTPDDVRGLDTRAQIALVLERASRRVPDFDERRAIALVDVFKANLRAGINWEPRPYAGKVTVFRAEGSDRLGPDGTGEWGAFAEAVGVVTVPGDHFSMVKPPHVEALARALREAL
jgi:thioesterase domain-containing protein